MVFSFFFFFLVFFFQHCTFTHTLSNVVQSHGINVQFVLIFPRLRIDQTLVQTRHGNMLPWDCDSVFAGCAHNRSPADPVQQGELTKACESAMKSLTALCADMTTSFLFWHATVHWEAGRTSCVLPSEIDVFLVLVTIARFLFLPEYPATRKKV